jgi:predicted acylesterase/phospholipase RssA
MVKVADSRLTFSFDSSCWLFIYHFGVAKWIQDNVHVTKESFAFSGSSGGALVAAVLACQFDAEEVKDLALADFHLCQKNPLLMFRVGEKILDHYLHDNAKSAERCSDHLRVLLTKVSPSPPLLTAEVASKFGSWREVFACLRGSMHVPFAAGILPYPIPGRGWYYDGLLWAALFVPWRAFDDDDVVVRVSACGFPNSQIGPQLPFPLWWLIMPPSKEVLEGMFWMGYRDTAAYFAEVHPDGRTEFTESSTMSCGRCNRRARNRVEHGQIEQLRKHLRKNRKNGLLDHKSAARHVAALESTAKRHWQIAFLCMMAVFVSISAITLSFLS